MIILQVISSCQGWKERDWRLEQSMGRVWQWPYDAGSSVDSVLVENLQH